MIPADYKCTKCGSIFEYDKPYGVSFPEEIECKECGHPSKRIFKVGYTMVPAGRLGNGKVGY